MADSDEERTNAKLHQNQPYDESLDVPDAEEIASTYSPTPRVTNPAERGIMSRGNSPPHSELSDDEDDDDDDEFEEMKHPQAAKAPSRGGPPQQAGSLQQQQQQQFQSEEEDDGSESSEEDDDDDVQVEGAYDPAEYDSLQVTPEIKELFQYITRYTPQSIELDTKMKPFIPDFIPAVGDIDAFLKISRPDGKPDTLGLSVLDEPCAKQSDPTVLDLQLRAISKQTTAKQLIVKSLGNADKNPKHIENWIDSIRDLHRSKPPPNVHYSKNMPDFDSLMQEWPPEFEDLLKETGLPTADIDCDLGQYVEIICSLLDIPIYKNSTQKNEKVQALHVLFTLYSEFKNSQHFRALADENNIDNGLKDDYGGDEDRLVL
ncbi:hypothetical protein LOTGIDRAFT_153208 [Lottia gigantea]|uniref:Intraflagellar transport protein 46 homolog n=1 Tax=Lottia gigantea TaxID=225164 RepID=V4BXC9_LOTGI|nr:hypothetical protein LOTGIDRAFT_153208 [Lottia gigantea]ESO93749.1 hypothetical protein LOTGIDRAFT_153208 [Lottia gigantea]